MKLFLFVAFWISSALVFHPAARAHCEVPCGIYGDQLRFSLLSEHISTIEKSMIQIEELQKKQTKDHNQIVRWVEAKDAHAQKIQHIVHQYFMTQRIKPVEKRDSSAYKTYVEQLVLTHQLLVYAMKAKQTTDLAHTKKMTSLLKRFESIYFAKE